MNKVTELVNRVKCDSSVQGARDNVKLVEEEIKKKTALLKETRESLLDVFIVSVLNEWSDGISFQVGDSSEEKRNSFMLNGATTELQLLVDDDGDRRYRFTLGNKSYGTIRVEVDHVYNITLHPSNGEPEFTLIEAVNLVIIELGLGKSLE